MNKQDVVETEKVSVDGTEGNIMKNLWASIMESRESVLAILGVFAFVFFNAVAKTYDPQAIEGIKIVVMSGGVLALTLDALRRIRVNGFIWELVEMGALVVMLVVFGLVFHFLAPAFYAGSYHFLIEAIAFVFGLIFITKVARRGELDYTPVVGYLIGTVIIVNLVQHSWAMTLPLILAVIVQGMELWRDRNWQAIPVAIVGIPFMLVMNSWTGAIVGIIVAGFIAPTVLGWISNKWDFFTPFVNKMVHFGIQDTKTEEEVQLVSLYFSIEGIMTYTILTSVFCYLISIL
ncbi:MAG: hypothetical protein OEX81_00935 [Candidatus Pacebacteria bacterium]|nr:hypothetical protein [Candidatus Paceibacterota bacterium]